MVGKYPLGLAPCCAGCDGLLGNGKIMQLEKFRGSWHCLKTSAILSLLKGRFRKVIKDIG